jgi:hypothetical protein
MYVILLLKMGKEKQKSYTFEDDLSTSWELPISEIEISHGLLSTSIICLFDMKQNSVFRLL